MKNSSLKTSLVSCLILFTIVFLDGAEWYYAANSTSTNFFWYEGMMTSYLVFPISVFVLFTTSIIPIIKFSFDQSLFVWEWKKHIIFYVILTIMITFVVNIALVNGYFPLLGVPFSLGFLALALPMIRGLILLVELSVESNKRKNSMKKFSKRPIRDIVCD